MDSDFQNAILPSGTLGSPMGAARQIKMSDYAPSQPLQLAPGDLIALVRDYGITLDLGAEDLRRIEARAAGLVAEGEAVADLIAELCGPSPGAVAGQIRTLLLMGGGYHRAVRDGLRAMLAARARDERARQANRPDAAAPSAAEGARIRWGRVGKTSRAKGRAKTL